MKHLLWLIIGLLIGATGTFFGLRVRTVSNQNVEKELHKTGKEPPLVTTLAKELTNPFSPIKFNAKVNEYQLVYGYNTNEIVGNVTNIVRYTIYCPLRYDPWTGEKLPDTTRPDVHLTPFRE